MSQNKKNPQFRKSVDWDSVNKSKTSTRVPNSQDSRRNKILEQRRRAKLELINKYNMTEEEAEETLRNIERKAREKRNRETEALKVQRFIEEDDDVIIPIHAQNKKESLEEAVAEPAFESNVGLDDGILEEAPVEPAFEGKKELNKESTEEKSIKPIPSQEQKADNSQIKDKKVSDNKDIKINQDPIRKPSQNVDSLISDLIPDTDKDLSIEVNNVSLSFEVGKDKIDNLKEYVIRTIKRNKEKRTRFQALKNISFKIYKGDKVGIIGYNGAGKSTLLNVITGIYPPESGEVKTYGRISPLLALGAGFYPNYSGRENIYLNGAIMGYDKKFLESKYDEIVEFSELGEFIDFPVKNYSSGMMAKLGFSIATIVEPDILIIDEVLGVGDVNFKKKSNDKLRSLMDKGTTVLLVSHSIPTIRSLCDKAIWINQGEVVEIGEVNDVCNHYLKDAEKATKEQTKDIRFR